MVELPQEQVIDRAESVAAAASGQDGPLRMLAAWLIIVGAVIVSATVGTVATIILVALIIPILALGVIWVVSRNLSEQEVAGYDVQEVALIAGPILSVVFFAIGSWPVGVFVALATIAIAAA